MWVLCLYAYLYTMCMTNTQRHQKRVLDSLELNLQMVSSHHVDAGRQTRVFCKSSQCFSLLQKPSLQPPDFTLLLWPSEPHTFIYLSSLFLNTVTCKYGEVGACSWVSHTGMQWEYQTSELGGIKAFYFTWHLSCLHYAPLFLITYN